MPVGPARVTSDGRLELIGERLGDEPLVIE